VAKDISQAREALIAKAKTYYSSEALNPRPKRGRPPKQVVKVEAEPQVCVDLYTTVPLVARPFLFIPDIHSAASVTFSAKYENERQLRASLRGSTRMKVDTTKLEELSKRLEALRTLSSQVAGLTGITEDADEERKLKGMLLRIEKGTEDEGTKTKKISGLMQGSLTSKKSRNEEAETETPAKPQVKTVTPLGFKKKK